MREWEKEKKSRRERERERESEKAKEKGIDGHGVEERETGAYIELHRAQMDGYKKRKGERERERDTHKEIKVLEIEAQTDFAQSNLGF